MPFLPDVRCLIPQITESGVWMQLNAMAFMLPWHLRLFASLAAKPRVPGGGRMWVAICRPDHGQVLCSCRLKSQPPHVEINMMQHRAVLYHVEINMVRRLASMLNAKVECQCRIPLLNVVVDCQW